MTQERKPVVVMTATGRAKEYAAGSTIQEVLDTVYAENQRGGSDYDRPTKLFIGGECVVPTGLAEIAWEYGKFYRVKEDELFEAMEDWIDQRFGRAVEKPV